MPLFENVVDTATAQQEMAEKRLTLSAQGRMQALVLSILPLGILPILMGLDERFAAYYQQDIVGACVLFFVTALLIGAQGWLQQIVGDGT